MIKQIVKCLKKIKEISDWKLVVTQSKTTEAFFVLEQLETTRATNTIEYEVTVYRKSWKNGEAYVGSSTILIPHEMSDQELIAFLNSAVYSAGMVSNKYYELVKGDKKRSWQESSSLSNPLDALDQIAKVFFEVSTENRQFNSLELFHIENTIRILNSQGIDYTKTLHSVEVEAIPSYNGEKQKVEIYKYYRYKQIDNEQIKHDALDALNEVESRYLAEHLTEKKNVDIILRDEEVYQLVRELISTSSYESVYKGSALVKENDYVQKDAIGDKLTINLTPSSTTDGFDLDGVLLKPVKIVEEGRLVQHFGNNQYAYYLGVKPTGIMRFTKVELGTNSIEEMKKTPYLEILSLSGLQLDIYNSYIGGEVRLANYFDGEKTKPLTNFSFSGNLTETLKDIILSKESTISTSYEGPKYIKLKNLEIL